MEGESRFGRPVTPAEAAVLSVFFESVPGPEKERILSSGLQRTTFQKAKKRLYDGGLVEDRYIPYPSAFGLPTATFLLARPYSENRVSLASALAESPGSVVVWSAISMVFAVMFHRSQEEARRAIGRLSKLVGENKFSSSADLSLPEVQVQCYFDFDGLWKNLVGVPGGTRYPHPLGGPRRISSGRTRGSLYLEAARKLVNRPFLPQGEGWAAHMLGPHRLPSLQEKLVREGLVEWHVFPRLPAFPSYATGKAADLVFVTGTLNKGDEVELLFGLLRERCAAFPFLFTTDRERLLIGFLGMGRPAHPVGSSDKGRPSVMGLLGQSLTKIEVIREPLSSLRVLVDHRYDRLPLEW